MTTTHAGQWGPEVLVDATFIPISSATLTLFEDDGVTPAVRYLNRNRTAAANPWTFLGPDNLTVFAEPNGYVLSVVTGSATAALDIVVAVDPDDVIAGMGGGTSSNTLSGLLTATDNGLAADARHAADGLIAAGSALLSSAGLAFTSADNGRTVNVTVPDVILGTTGAVVSGTPTLTVAGHGLTSAAVGKTIQVDGAGAAGVLLTTTIAAVPTSGTITLAANAATTVTVAKVRVQTPPLHTTVSSVTAGVATLAAAASYAYASADVVVGTDNRAAFSALCSTACAAGREKPVYFPPGGYMIALDTTNHDATATLAGYLKLLGAGVRDTTIHVVHKTLTTTTQTNLVHMTSTATQDGVVEMQDMTVNYYGPSQDGHGSNVGPRIIWTAPAASSGKRLEIRLARVNMTGVAKAMHMDSGSSTAASIVRRIIAEDCELSCRSNNLSFFANTGETDNRYVVRRTKMTNTEVMLSSANFAVYQIGNLYSHPSVDVDFDGSDFITTQNQGASWNVQHYSGTSTADVCNFFRIRNCTFSGSTQGLIIQSQVSGEKYNHHQIESTTFANGGQALVLYQGAAGQPTYVTAIDCTFKGGAAAVGQQIATNTDPGVHKFIGCRFTSENMTNAQNVVTIGGNGSTWLFDTCEIFLSGASSAIANNFVGQANVAALYCRIINSLVVGGTGYTGGFSGAGRDGLYMTIEGCIFLGVFSGNIISNTNVTADGTADINLVHNRFLFTTGKVCASNLTFRNSNYRGRDNFVAASANGPFVAASSSWELTPPVAKQPTAIASAATINPDWNHDFFDVSGTTTVANIKVGQDATTNAARGGMIYLKPTGVFTIQNNGGGTGNIRTITGADITTIAGRVYVFRSEPSTGLWWEVGGPAVA